MNKIVIPVEGMTCGGCVASVERTLGSTSGVKAAKASLEGKNVEVEFDAGVVAQGQIEAAIRDAGFDVPA